MQAFSVKDKIHLGIGLGNNVTSIVIDNYKQI